MTTEAADLVLYTVKAKLEHAERQLAAALADCAMLRNALAAFVQNSIYSPHNSIYSRGPHDQ